MGPKMLICVEEDIHGNPGTYLTYECGELPRGTTVEIVSGRLTGMTGTVVGPSTEEFNYYEKARLKIGA